MKINKNIIFNKVDLKLYFYLFIALIFLVTVGIRAVRGDIDFEFYADSETYLEIMDENYSISEIILLSPNLLGPYVTLSALQQSFIAVYLLHVLIIIFFYSKITKLYDLNKKVVFLFMCISPILFSSIILINKEILSILVITLFFIYYKKKSIIVLVLAIICSFLVRWQLTLFIVSLTILLSPLNFLKNRSLLSLSVFLCGVSFLYYLNIDKFEAVNQVVEMSERMGTDSEGSGLFYKLINIQNSNPLGYVIVFIPKALYLYIGLLSRYYNFFTYTDFYNNVIVFSQCVMNFIVMIGVIRKKVPLHNVFLFSAVVYCIIFALSNIYSPRYFFPVYILMILALASHKTDKKSDSKLEKIFYL